MAAIQSTQRLRELIETYGVEVEITLVHANAATAPGDAAVSAGRVAADGR